jgi:hypothetical protein
LAEGKTVRIAYEPGEARIVQPSWMLARPAWEPGALIAKGQIVSEGYAQVDDSPSAR